MHALRRTCSAILTIALGSARAAWAGPGDPAAAYGLHEQAHRCYQQGNFACALEKLNRAMQVAPAAEAYQVLYDIAQVYNAMGDWVHAAKTYREYLQDGGSRLPSSERDKVDKKLRELESLIATITVVTDVPGAEVLLDKERVGTAPLETPLHVNAGPHDVSVRVRGYPDQTQSATFPGGSRDRLTFTFGSVPISPSSSPASPPAPPSAQQESLPPPVTTTRHSQAPVRAIAWSATGILAVGASVTGILALSANSKFDQRLHEYPGDPGAINSERTRANTFATVTDVLWIATAVAGGVSLWLTLDGNALGVQTAAGRSARLGVSVGAGPSELRLRMQF